MTTGSNIQDVLVVGATGRTGREVVAAALEAGLTPIALVRDLKRAERVLPGVRAVEGDLTDASSLAEAVADVDAIVFVHGSDNAGGDYEAVDYGGVVNVLSALDGRRPRIVLMTTFFITHRDHYFNDGGHALDWKRRSEHLVRASGLPYTIVRPGWLDAQVTGSRVSVLQGDAHEGGITRPTLGRVLVAALRSPDALGTTVEVFEVEGPATEWDGLFAGTRGDVPGDLDGQADPDNLPLADEPERVRSTLERLRA